MQDMLEKKIPVDIISVDQIWLADFAEMACYPILLIGLRNGEDFLIGIRPIWMV